MPRRLARRTDREAKTGQDRWLVSYSDFITLLFAFFVVMYSVSQVSEDKYRTLAETLNSTFIQQSPSENDSEITDPDSLHESDIASLEALQSEFENIFESPAVGAINLSANENWIELTLPSELLFATGSATPNKEANQIFSELADVIAEYENEVQVVGHTDNVPIRNREFPNNWYLSSARAVAIVNYLSFQGVNPERLSAIGFGEYRPLADNNTEEGRSQNRRVVLRVSSQMAPAQKRDAQSIFDDPSITRAREQIDEAQQITPVSSDSNNSFQNETAEEGSVKPVRLKGGDLLFTSDPNLPRLRELEPE